jgi:hypothetical protein
MNIPLSELSSKELQLRCNPSDFPLKINLQTQSFANASTSKQASIDNSSTHTQGNSLSMAQSQISANINSLE